jgi:hypothetical protein
MVAGLLPWCRLGGDGRDGGCSGGRGGDDLDSFSVDYDYLDVAVGSAIAIVKMLMLALLLGVVGAVVVAAAIATGSIA